MAYIVCPSIENKNDDNGNSELEDFIPLSIFDIAKEENHKGIKLNSVIDTYNLLSKEIFPDIRIGMLHGKMNQRRKNRI